MLCARQSSSSSQPKRETFVSRFVGRPALAGYSSAQLVYLCPRYTELMYARAQIRFLDPAFRLQPVAQAAVVLDAGVGEREMFDQGDRPRSSGCASKRPFAARCSILTGVKAVRHNSMEHHCPAHCISSTSASMDLLNESSSCASQQEPSCRVSLTAFTGCDISCGAPKQCCYHRFWVFRASLVPLARAIDLPRSVTTRGGAAALYRCAGARRRLSVKSLL